MSTDYSPESLTERDPTWVKATEIVRETIDISSHVCRLFKGGWACEADSNEYLKIVGFARLNPKCLLLAAGVSKSSDQTGVKALEQAIFGLGIKLSAVVLAINFTSKKILSKTPPVGWKSLFQNMMTSIETGYKFGAKIGTVGLEGGALIAFAPVASEAILMAHMPEEYKSYQNLIRKNKKVTAHEEKEIFGCERFQIAAALIQHLGFGHEIALGTAFGMLRTKNVEESPAILNWQAACQWIIALKEGRNYPAALHIRNHFPELKPGTPQERNLNLEVLHTEVSKLTNDSSSWLWHLPFSSYDETKEAYKLS